MSRTARVLTGPATVSPSRALAALARAAATSGGPLVVVREGAYRELIAELGGAEAAVRFLAKLAGNTQRPLAVNLPAPDGSTTIFVSPRGWAAGRHEELEAAFGAATVRSLDAQ